MTWTSSHDLSVHHHTMLGYFDCPGLWPQGKIIQDSCLFFGKLSSSFGKLSSRFGKLSSMLGKLSSMLGKLREIQMFLF